VKRASILLTVIGLLIAGLLLDVAGVRDVLGRVLAVGWRGFAVVLAWQGVLFVVLGSAWTILAAGGPRTLLVLIWARMVRDAASNCLPLAQVGGFLLGARAATLQGMAWETAAASTVVDATAEVLAQVVFAVVGLCILVAREPDSKLAIPIAIGLFVAVLAIAGFMVAQIGASGLFARLGRRIASHRFADARERAGLLAGALDDIYRCPARLVLAALLHLIGWLGTGIAGWVAFRLLGADLEIEDAIAIEGLLHALLAAAFLIPGNIGVQEAGYTALGAVFGIPAELSLGASLLRRGRDLAVGIPVLLIYEVVEMRRPSRGRVTDNSSDTGGNSTVGSSLGRRRSRPASAARR
jgi:putative membrane protein